MAEYIERRRLLDYADAIAPTDDDYLNIETTKRAALDAREDIAEDLRYFRHVDIDTARIRNDTIYAAFNVFCSTMNALSKECGCCPYVWCDNGTCYDKFKADVTMEWRKTHEAD